MQSCFQGRRPCGLQEGERIDIHLQAAPGAFVRLLLRLDLRRLEIDDDLSFRKAVDPVPPPGEPELTLLPFEGSFQRFRYEARSLLSCDEPLQGLFAGLLLHLLVLPAEETLVYPAVPVLCQHVPQGRVFPRHPLLQIEMNGAVQDTAIHQVVMGGHRDPDHVPVAKLQGADEIVIHLVKTQPQCLLRAAPHCPGRLFGPRGVALDLLQGRGLLCGLRGPGQIQRFEDKRAHLLEPLEAVITGPGQIEGVFRPRHPHVEQASLLLDITESIRGCTGIRRPGRLRVAQDRIRDRNPFLARTPGIAVGDQPDHEGHRELQALGLVHGQHVDRILFQLCFSRGGIVPDLPEEFQVFGEGEQGICIGHLGKILDLVEEDPDVLDAQLGPGGQFARELLKEARPFQERVHDLTGVLMGGQLHKITQVLIDAADGIPGRLLNLDGIAAKMEALEDLVQAQVFLVGEIGHGSEIIGIHPVDFRERQMEEAGTVFKIGHTPNEGGEDPDLFLCVESPAAGETVGDIPHVQGSQVRVCICIGPNQDGDIAVSTAVRHALPDDISHAIGLMGQGVELQHLDALPP